MSHKQLDAKNRWRNKTVAFRVSPEEAKAIDRMALLSGMSKQDYLAARCLQQTITVVPNIRVQRGLNRLLEEILFHLKAGTELPTDIVESLTMLTSIVTNLS